VCEIREIVKDMMVFLGKTQQNKKRVGKCSTLREQGSRLFFVVLFMLACNIDASAQKIAVKTNLLYDAMSIPSLGAEVAVGDHYTLSLMGSYDPIRYGNVKWKNFSYQPEIRFWFHRAFTGPYMGMNVSGGGMNIDKLHIGGLYGKHRQGHFIGAGLNVGYNLILSPHCSFDFSLGADFVHTKYDRYREGDNPYKEGKSCSNMGVPIGTGVTFIYIIK
jgi:hypothetical protein